MKEWAKAYVSLTALAAVLVLGVMFCGPACTYNQITFHPDCVRFTEKLTVEPGQGGDSSDTGSTSEGAGVGGTGKLSPGGSNLLDGQLQFALIIQQGGETPSSTPVTVDVSGLPGG